MGLLSYALTTKDNLKTFLNISGSAKDAMLELLIDAFTDQIESYCGRRFKDTTYTNEEYDGTGTETLILKNYPITTTTTFKLEENSKPDNEDNWSELASRRYWQDTNEGLVRSYDFTFLKSPYKYRVTYSAGYTTIPSDLEMACIMLCSQYFEKGGSTGVLSESLGDHSITFDKFSQLAGNTTVKVILDKYKDLRV